PRRSVSNPDVLMSRSCSRTAAPAATGSPRGKHVDGSGFPYLLTAAGRAHPPRLIISGGAGLYRESYCGQRNQVFTDGTIIAFGCTSLGGYIHAVSAIACGSGRNAGLIPCSEHHPGKRSPGPGWLPRRAVRKRLLRLEPSSCPRC